MCRKPLSRTRVRGWGEGTLLLTNFSKRFPHPPLRGTFPRTREKDKRLLPDSRH
jgi:hypothetical protein